mmetsp:Transcript_37786/g.100536  ORF Transcript_37786/g.100536 Transcript_37786/m.100536 type:complete len:101 (-) Transcript_37786:1368-1670(-)
MCLVVAWTLSVVELTQLKMVCICQTAMTPEPLTALPVATTWASVLELGLLAKQVRATLDRVDLVLYYEKRSARESPSSATVAEILEIQCQTAFARQAFAS